MERVGLIGIGKMGKPMSLNLCKAGFPLSIYDQHRDAVQEVIDAGATWVDSSRVVAEVSDVVITMLPNSSDVEEVILGPNGVLEGRHDGLVVVDMSTIAPTTSKRIAEVCLKCGVPFIDAPVSGGVRGATNATLTVIAGGEAATIDRLRPVFEAIGSADHIVQVGTSGAGEVVKLINQHLLGVIAAATLEAFVVGVKAGVDVEVMARVVSASSGGSWQLTHSIRDRVFNGTFEPGFTTNLLIKDLRLVLDLAQALDTPVMLAAVAIQMYQAACAQGYGHMDYTSVVRPLERLTGVEVRTTARTD